MEKSPFVAAKFTFMRADGTQMSYTWQEGFVSAMTREELLEYVNHDVRDIVSKSAWNCKESK
ncbi:MAG: hypothetical protein V4563_17320 [Pseudomonadota bacterium]